jgi:hypothetical protein
VNTGTVPAVVYLIRHGEKLGNPADEKQGGPHLSVLGSARALALPTLFMTSSSDTGSGNPGSAPSCDLTVESAEFTASYSERSVDQVQQPPFKAPAAIFATHYDPAGEATTSGGGTNSARPIETITPLSTALKVPINSDYADTDGDVKKLASQVTSGYDNQVVLICWHHGKLPELAGYLGISNPPKWPQTEFNQLWEIDFSADPPTLTAHQENVLYTDAAHSNQ